MYIVYSYIYGPGTALLSKCKKFKKIKYTNHLTVKEYNIYILAGANILQMTHLNYQFYFVIDFMFCMVHPRQDIVICINLTFHPLLLQLLRVLDSKH